jgi:hypothetical protein
MAVKRFDIVGFIPGRDPRGAPRYGIVIDNYLLDEQQWVKVLTASELDDVISDQQIELIQPVPNVVYRISDSKDVAFSQRLVGIVSKNSRIEKIRFEYSFKVPVAEGALLEARIGKDAVLYQIVEGITDTELLETKNEAGLIFGEAVQLGKWNEGTRTFDRCGWVPSMNSPVLTAAPITAPDIGEDEFQVGNIPETNFPVLLNKEEAITHHTAVLGVTGTGKSVFVRNLMRQLLDDSTKIICIDFTNEYAPRMGDLRMRPLTDGETSEKIFKAIDIIADEMAKFENQRDKAKIAKCEAGILNCFSQSIEEFLKSEDHVSLFELPDVANTTGILEYTKWFFKALFKIAKGDANFGKRVCVVLEEAHTIIPEWNFLGIADKRADAVVNSIGQVALQGRKYNVGFIIVAQRTANVSKTVLTQCNTIIAFQQFDRTSGEFLSNYMNTAMIETLPRLKSRHAIAVGKAFRGSVPVIFRVPEITEPKPLSRESNEDNKAEQSNA